MRISASKKCINDENQKKGRNEKKTRILTQSNRHRLEEKIDKKLNTQRTTNSISMERRFMNNSNGTSIQKKVNDDEKSKAGKK